MDLDKQISEETCKDGKDFAFQDASFRISPYNKRYENKVARLTDAFRKRNRGRVGTPEQQREINCEAAFGTILHGWNNIKRGEAEIPFNADNSKALLLKYQSIRNFVFETANDTASFAETVESEETETDADVTGQLPEGNGGTAEQGGNGAQAETKSGTDLGSEVQP